MDDPKRADKKHRKLTRTPEVSQCDNAVPNVLEHLSSSTHHHSSSTPNSGHVTPVHPQLPLNNLSSAVHRNHSSSTNVAALKDNNGTITASASSLSFSSLLSSSASFFHHHNHHQNNADSGSNNGTSNCHQSGKSAFQAQSLPVVEATKARSASSLLHPGSVQQQQDVDKENHSLGGEECLKSTASPSASPSSVSPAIPIKSSATHNTISRGLEYFRGTRTTATSAASPTAPFNANNNSNYVSCTVDTGGGGGVATEKEQATSNNPQKQQQHLLIKPEESSLSPSSSAFSLKRFSSFSFNRGSRAKRNVAKDGLSEDHSHPHQHQHPHQPPSTPARSINTPISNSSVYGDASSSPSPTTATSVVGGLLRTAASTSADDCVVGSGVKTISPRRNKVSTNPFHQHSSSTSTSSSMSYQLSTDNVIDIIPACCLKVTPFQQHQPQTPVATSIIGASPRGGGTVAAKDSNDSTSSDGGGGGGEGRVGGVSFVCSSCGIENRVTGVLNEARTRERLHVTGTKAPSFQAELVPAEGAVAVNDVRAPRATSPRTVQIQIKRNCPNQRDPSSDREDCMVASEDFTSFMSTNPFLSDTIKRDEFLKATMRICLVVSPPATRLQVPEINGFFFALLYFMQTRRQERIVATTRTDFSLFAIKLLFELTLL